MGGVVRKWERGRKQVGFSEMRQGKFPDKVVFPVYLHTTLSAFGIYMCTRIKSLLSKYK